MTDPKSKKKGIYYGWYVIAALFFASFLAIGSRQGFGVFVKTWEEDWGVSTAAISLAAAIGWLMNGLSQPLVGFLTDKYGGRPVLVVSLAVMASATVAVASISNVFGLIVLYGFVISFASGGISPATTGVVVARWFDRKRGTAMSILIAGGSVGGLIVVPFLSYVLIEYGWRTAWVLIGALALGLGIPLLLLVVRSKPSDMGLHIDGEEPVVSDDGETEISVRPVGPKFVEQWKDALGSKPIWQLSFAYFVCGITTASISVHFVRWAISEDISHWYSCLGVRGTQRYQCAGRLGNRNTFRSLAAKEPARCGLFNSWFGVCFADSCAGTSGHLGIRCDRRNVVVGNCPTDRFFDRRRVRCSQSGYVVWLGEHVSSAGWSRSCSAVRLGVHEIGFLRHSVCSRCRDFDCGRNRFAVDS